MTTRTYFVRTFGCQMNAHDSERLSGMLESAGYIPAESEDADVVVYNTCAVRENADNKLYGNLGMLVRQREKRPGMQIAVGGCLAQKDRHEILRRAPWVDVVFGTHNFGSLPVLLERARINNEAQIEILEALEVFPSSLPTKRDSIHSALVAISVGCNNTCTFCIVPTLRGKEKDRKAGEILDEINSLVSEGVMEVMLLGQNVNSYGVEFGDKFAFGKLLRACGQIEGLERVRFISPHPKDFTEDVIDAMAETPNVMPHLHMPLQSRERIPDAAITTDIIVGFPGETEEDFQDTINLVREARFATAFTYQYSKRPGTPAAEMPDQISPEVISERYNRLTEVVNEVMLEENQKQVGKIVEVLVTNHEGKKDEANAKLSGRARDNRLVHFNFESEQVIRPGDLVEVEITYAAPFFLLSGKPALKIKNTRAGDIFSESKNVEKSDKVLLGIPTLVRS